MRWVLRSKIHNATVTEANVDYVGSITMDADLVDQAGLWAGEQVLVVSNTTGARLETYLIAGPRGSGSICMNAAGARRGALTVSSTGLAGRLNPQRLRGHWTGGNFTSFPRSPVGRLR